MSIQGASKKRKTTSEEQKQKGRQASLKHRETEAATKEALLARYEELSALFELQLQNIKALKMENQALIEQRNFQRWFLQDAFRLQSAAESSPTEPLQAVDESATNNDNNDYEKYLNI